MKLKLIVELDEKWLLAELKEHQGDELGSLAAVALYITAHAGVDAAGTLWDLHGRLRNAAHKKKHGPNSRDPMKTMALAFAAAKVHALRQREGCTEKDALTRVAKVDRLPVKAIENFIDEYQRGRLKNGADWYEQLIGIKPLDLRGRPFSWV